MEPRRAAAAVLAVSAAVLALLAAVYRYTGFVEEWAVELPGYTVLCGVLGDRVYALRLPEPSGSAVLEARSTSDGSLQASLQLPRGLRVVDCGVLEDHHVVAVFASNWTATPPYIQLLLVDPAGMAIEDALRLPPPGWKGFGYSGFGGLEMDATYCSNTSYQAWLYVFPGSIAYTVNASLSEPDVLRIQMRVEDIVSRETLLELEGEAKLPPGAGIRCSSPQVEYMEDDRLVLYLPIGTRDTPWLLLDVDLADRRVAAEPRRMLVAVIRMEKPEEVAALQEALGTDNPISIRAKTSRGGYTYVVATIMETGVMYHNPYGFATFLTALDSQGRIAQVKVVPGRVCWRAVAAEDNTTMIVGLEHSLRAYRLEEPDRLPPRLYIVLSMLDAHMPLEPVPAAPAAAAAALALRGGRQRSRDRDTQRQGG
ncbi:hypothetical protein [Pyrodictium abyssi]|uniref:Uncharacterized protein n=1 Tax=Pyrodictium abyssi TaxID=54256 RepID=A0ABM8IZN3_9CREN|nr:hypothetical protein PABY_12540 [Pyrodictium abyssi]